MATTQYVFAGIDEGAPERVTEYVAGATLPMVMVVLPLLGLTVYAFPAIVEIE